MGSAQRPQKWLFGRGATLLSHSWPPQRQPGYFQPGDGLWLHQQCSTAVRPAAASPSLESTPESSLSDTATVRAFPSAQGERGQSSLDFPWYSPKVYSPLQSIAAFGSERESHIVSQVLSFRRPANSDKRLLSIPPLSNTSSKDTTPAVPAPPPLTILIRKKTGSHLKDTVRMKALVYCSQIFSYARSFLLVWTKGNFFTSHVLHASQQTSVFALRWGLPGVSQNP